MYKMRKLSRLERILGNYLFNPLIAAGLIGALAFPQKAGAKEIYIPKDFSTIQEAIDKAEKVMF
jgi:hypothetical protein